MQHNSFQQHRCDHSLSANGLEDDEDLLLFQEMQKREREATHESMALPQISSGVPPKSAGESIFSSSEWNEHSSSEWNEHDYDWLMTPPLTPLLSSLEENARGVYGFSPDGSVPVRNTPTVIAKVGSSKLGPPRAKPLAKTARRSFDIHKLADPSVALATSTSSVSRKSLSAATRSSTPSCFGTSVAQPIARSLTPNKSIASRASVRSSTPTSWVAPPNHSASSIRRVAPIKRPAKSTPTRVNGPSTASLKQSSVNKTSSLPAKGVSSIHPSCPATRAWLNAPQSGILLETPQESRPNLRSSAAERPLSNPRGSVALKFNASAAAANATPPQSPAVSARNMGSSSSSMVTRGCVSSDSLDREKPSSRHAKLHDAAMISMSHGVGSDMVGKNMPPKKCLPLSQEKTHFVVNTPAKRTVQPTLPRDKKSTCLVRQSPGFGQILSKPSLDTALRHMDIRGSTSKGVQSSMLNAPSSSLYSVTSRNSRSIANGCGNQTSSVNSSPMATSSNASSEHSMSIAIDLENSELGDETSSSRASPVSQPDPSTAISNERKMSYWLGSPGYIDDDGADIMKNFEQEFASLSGTESPLVSQSEGNIDCDDFILEPI